MCYLNLTTPVASYTINNT